MVLQWYSAHSICFGLTGSDVFRCSNGNVQSKCEYSWCKNLVANFLADKGPAFSPKSTCVLEERQVTSRHRLNPPRTSTEQQAAH